MKKQIYKKFIEFEIKNGVLLKYNGSNENVVIPNYVIKIGNGAFSDCTWITSLTIPDSVTKIGASAFRDCTGLTSVTIGNSLTEIGAWAFGGCTGLETIYYAGSKKEWDSIYINIGNMDLHGTKIYYNAKGF